MKLCSLLSEISCWQKYQCLNMHLERKGSSLKSNLCVHILYAKQRDRCGSQNPILKKLHDFLFHGIFMSAWRSLEAVYARLSLVFDPKSQEFPKLVGWLTKRNKNIWHLRSVHCHVSKNTLNVFKWKKNLHKWTRWFRIASLLTYPETFSPQAPGCFWATRHRCKPGKNCSV